MGDHNVNVTSKQEDRSRFIKHLLEDVKALEELINSGQIEDDIIRIGAEQEFCLVDLNGRPAFNSIELLEKINDEHFTTELARYNLEINLDPIELKGNALSKVEEQLENLMARANKIASEENTKILLTGILPTITKKHLDFEYMTPNPRYWALNDLIKERRGRDFEIHIRGLDELSLKHDSVLFEACNTSFQMHLQIAPDDFIASYNWSQAIAGPIMSICCNSPILLGLELWSETRLALFQQSIDTRTSSHALVDQQARVTFGNGWAWGDAIDIFKNDIARYKIILTKDIEKHSLEEVKAGRAPKLEALNLFNGTVYRWNRACYGVGGGKAHLRIENRYIPSGPTTLDEMANFALWVGIMKGRPSKYDDMSKVMNFKDAKNNMVKAARYGKESVLKWEGELITAEELTLQYLIPMAKDGLRKMKIDEKDIERFLGIIERRAKGITGDQWIVRHYRELSKSLKTNDAVLSLSNALQLHQNSGKPVSDWPSPEILTHQIEGSYLIRHIMSTKMFTVKENDIASLATSIMQWWNIHHLPVEDSDKKLCGILTWNHMEKYKEHETQTDMIVVRDIMEHNVKYMSPNDTIKDAVKLMKDNNIGCLPIVNDERIVGIITMNDLTSYLND